MYHQFYGENMLRADVCNAVEELGQLLDHNGAIGESERNAARIFNADHCFFVTNGTSTSNKMVWHHTVAPDDVVVVDRNCHKSVLHAIIMTGAVPVFLKPTRNHYGIIGPIPQSEFEPTAIQAKIKANPLLKGVDSKKVKPRVLTLTQSTYDGVLYNTETIKKMLDGYVANLHFDEAWLPHAAFHPFYGTYHSMGKKRERPVHSVVYATQSIHKLLAGISQASHVLVQDSQKTKLDRHLFNDAYQHQPAVQHHRQLRCGRGHDGATRWHRLGGRKHCRSARLPPRHAQGGRRVRQRLVVQGVGPRRLGG
jgi:ornithine decarboxylase/lysine decarboxylase/arginine decarboxylase